RKAADDVWHVQLSGGELRVLTLDQLDDAFQRGIVTKDTFVYQAGMDDWIKLKDLAGLGDGDDTRAGRHRAGTPVPKAPGATGSPPTPMVVRPSRTSGAGGKLVPPMPTVSRVNTKDIGPSSTAPVAADKPDLEFDSDSSSLSKRRTGRRFLIGVSM